MNENIRLGQEVAHHLDNVVQVILDLIKITIIGISYLRRNVAFADTVHIFSGNVDRADKRVAKIIDTTNQFTPAAGKFGGITASRKLTCHRRIYQPVRFCQQTTHRINAGIQVVFDFVEVTIICVSNFGWYVAFADTVHIFSGNVDRADKRVAKIIDTTNQFTPAAGKFGGITASRKLTCHRSSDQLVRLYNDTAYSIDYFPHGTL